ncbi:MAG: sigma-70 family RNA polymerase sigma factor [Bacteroidota bacterium]
MGIEHDPLAIVDKIRASETSRNAAIRNLVRDAVIRQKISAYILKNSGDQTDAETVFHDTIVTFVKKAFTDKKFTLTSHLHGYLMGTARNIWMNALRKKKRHVTVPIEHASTAESDGDNFGLLLKGERGKILQLVLNQMRKNCKDVLMHWAAGYKMEEISSKLSYKNGGVVKKKKSECMKELYNYLSENPHIKERIRPI